MQKRGEKEEEEERGRREERERDLEKGEKEFYVVTSICDHCVLTF